MNIDQSPGTTRATLYAGAALVAAIILGGAGGFALGRGSISERSASYLKQPDPEMTLLGPSRTALIDTLDLTPAQRVRVDSLLDDARQRAEGAVDRLMTDVRSVTSEARRQVREVLDDGQRARFDSLMSVASPVLPRTPLPPRRP